MPNFYGDAYRWVKLMGLSWDLISLKGPQTGMSIDMCVCLLMKFRKRRHCMGSRCICRYAKPIVVVSSWRKL